jgi:hypothetical protein
MDEVLVRFSLPDLYESALSRLKAACRFDPEKEMHVRMLDDARAVHRDWAVNAEIEAIAACFAPVAPRGRTLDIAGIVFECPAFERLEACDLTKVVLCATTLRAGAGPAQDVSRLFYADLWENAYVEAALGALRSKLAARADGVLSDFFGPGYYGMDLGEMKKLARVLDFGKIGAEVLDDGMIRPPKSCAGMFFVVRDAARMPADACRACVGDKAGCAFCGVSRQTLRRGSNLAPPESGREAYAKERGFFEI